MCEGVRIELSAGSYMYVQTELEPPRQLSYVQCMQGFIQGFSWEGGEDCMGVVGVGRVKHVLPRGVWGQIRCSEMDSGGFLAASRLEY